MGIFDVPFHGRGDKGIAAGDHGMNFTLKG